MNTHAMSRRLNKISLSLPGPTIPDGETFNLADLTSEQQAQFYALSARISTRLGANDYTMKQLTDDELRAICVLAAYAHSRETHT